jgi:uncharacterized protein with FMN-binding domain
VNTRYGPVQVTLTITGTRITAAGATAPSADAKSVQINNRAIPTLNAETVGAQSASIHAVSGASYTSDGYVQSLQSALDQAGL